MPSTVCGSAPSYINLKYLVVVQQMVYIKGLGVLLLIIKL